MIPAMSQDAINNVRAVEILSLQHPQVEIETDHVIHAGLYARTILIRKDTMITGALIKKATIVIVSGNILVSIGDKAIEINGYNVLPAAKNRKQAFYAKEDTYLTMIFATHADSVEEAENEFTDEADLLISRKSGSKNNITITGE